MRDLLLHGLPILDLLELTSSINSVAQWVNRDQSSVSRTYRWVSSTLRLGFRKRNGTYQARTNLELLASLRQSTQLLRLQRGAEHLHWVGAPWNGAALASLGPARPLPLPWGGQQRTLELLESRVLDLAVLDLNELELTAGPWSPVPLAHYPTLLRPELAALQKHARAGESTECPEHPCSDLTTASDVALVRSEIRQRPAIRSLIASLRLAYRQAYGHLQGMGWP